MTNDDTTPVGVAVCGDCNTRTDVFTTDSGLRCETCRDANTEVDLYPTYSPELRDFEDTRGEEMAANIEEFEENLEDIGFDVEMQDGSTWEMDKYDSHAVLMKYGENWDAFLPALARKVAEHFEKQTEPTKFAEYASWGASNHDASQDEYDTHAELAPIVAYSDLRAAKMQIALMAMSDDDEEAVTVVGLGDGEFNEYGEHGRITVEYDAEDDDEFGEGTDLDAVDETGGDN